MFIDKTKLTKFHLMMALSQRETVSIRDANNRLQEGRLHAIEREDGSGSSFNLALRVDPGCTVRVHVRTLD